VAFPEIGFALDGGGPAPLSCDSGQLARALTNLIKNAAESVTARTAAGCGPPGRIDIAISPGDTAITIRITDNGVGFPAEDRERLLEPYVTTRARGTGLGLAISAKIIEEHGGTLELADNPAGQGAAVIIRLARQLAAAADPASVLATA
jgi:two-component system nitrogen regulation sensor histidine kinase NtrY